MTTASDFITTSSLLAKAEELITDGRLDDAAGAVIEHLRRNPDHARGYFLLGSIAMKMGALAQSEQFLLKAISLGDSSDETQRVLSSNLQPARAAPGSAGRSKAPRG